MINQDKWINSLPSVVTKFNNEKNNLDHDRWIKTIPKKNTYDSIKKYSFIGSLFVCGLLFVSAVKNETRNLQKEINNLEASINVIKFNLDQAILDNEVITSPENISLLAKEHLNIDLVFYKRSQIKKLNAKNERINTVYKIKKEKINEKKSKSLSSSIKKQVAQKIEKKKTEIRKLQAFYSNPEKLPDEIKKQVTNKIEKKKIELENIYRTPKDVFTLERVGKWSVVQVVKLFLGMPVIPGR